ncbi:PspC domain-containing protein [Streptomyces sp. GC420]|uniref:PspC domain-containing protein n=1 Tax=Streptomyces sp. GC420 TaxID=2697568 RepID=UPI001FB85E55|nr:PspC domain-containing protein [Streptomyces sp. GC420]
MTEEPIADTAPGTGGAGAGAVQEPQPQPVRRSSRHKVFAGVCGGLGRYFDVDPVIFRIVLAVLAAAGGVGLIFYGFAWLFVPEENEDENEVRRLLTGRVEGATLAALLTALVGCGFFLSMLNNGAVLGFAVMLCAATAAAAYWSQKRRRPVQDGTPAPGPGAVGASGAPPETQAPPVPGAPSWWRDPLVKDGTTGPAGSGYLWGPEDAADVSFSSFSRGPAPGLSVQYAPRNGHGAWTAPPVRPRGPRWIGGWVFLFALIAFGLGSGLSWEERPLGTSLETGLAFALVVFGTGIAVSAFLGRTGAGSLVLALTTAGLLTASAAIPKDIGTDWVRTDWRPASAADVRPRYELGTGEGTLDLGRVDIAPGRTVTTAAEVGAGRLLVIVPGDATVRLDIEVGLGDVRLPDDKQNDVDISPGQERTLTLPPAAEEDGTGARDGNTKDKGAEDGADAGPRTLDLRLEVGLGQVEVTRAAS